MGTFQYSVAVGNQGRTRFGSTDVWVDSGATYTWLPGSLLRRLGFSPAFRRSFRFADRSTVQRELAQVPIRIGEEVLNTVVVFGDDNSAGLLGAVTMEEFSLGVDPVKHTLVPVVARATHAGATEDGVS